MQDRIRRMDWDYFRGAFTGVFFAAFVAGVALIAALWCLAALIVGSIAIVAVIAEAIR